MSKQTSVDWLSVKCALVLRFGFGEHDFSSMSMEMFWGYIEIMLKEHKKAGKPRDMSHREWIELQGKYVKPTE